MMSLTFPFPFVLLMTVSTVVVSSSSSDNDDSDRTAAWGARSYRRCLELSGSSKKAPLAACTTFQELLEESLDQQASMMSIATGVPASVILDGSFSNAFYRDVGDEIVDDVLEWMLKLRLRDEDRIRKRLQHQLGSFLLKVAAKDTNLQNVGRADERMAHMF